jgi:hypothetical protein
MDRSVNSEDIAETFGNSLILTFMNRFESKQDMPYMISIVYEGYSSSLNFKIKRVGNEVEAIFTTMIGESMTLRRF